METEFTISLGIINNYNGLNSLSRTLIAVTLILILLLSSFGILGLMHSKFVNAQEQKILNYTFKYNKYTSLPKMVMFELSSIQAIKDNGNLTEQNSFKQLIEEADSCLTEEPLSVMQKNQTASSGNKHDFLSLSPYYWPDPTKSNGLPYIYRDGERNPETLSIPDAQNMREMIQKVKILSVAYYFTNNVAYASKASELLRVWFLDKNTHMNPNLQHSEVIPGKNSGSHSGIIAGIYFPDLLDAIGLIRNSITWTDQNQRGIELWFGKYLKWLLNSDFGKEEGDALNNHRTWFDVQTSSIALFLNKTGIARDNLNNVDKLIATQIRTDGTQPFETHRRTSLDYYIFNLLAFFNLAKIGDYIEIDIWDRKTREGPGLRSSLEYILPYALDKEKWPYQQIKPIDTDKLLDLLCLASTHYEDNKTYKQAYRSFDQPNVTKKIENLIHGCPIA